MFQSIGPGELITIGLIALIVFGPHRLPEIARRVGGYVRDLRAAAADIRRGLDEEVRQLREPLEGMTKDLTKPVTEIKDTLNETADAVKESTKDATDALNRTVDEVKGAGNVEWIGPQPKTGVSPDDAWKGMDDPVPDGADSESEAPPDEEAAVDESGIADDQAAS